MPRTIYTIGEMLTQIPGIPDIEDLLADLAWLYQVSMEDRLVIWATVKPDLSLTDPVELLAQLGTGYSKIVAVLMEAGVALLKMPELTIAGKAHGFRDQQRDGAGFHDIEARVKIELHTF
jgi:hypothetical protein